MSALAGDRDPEAQIRVLVQIQHLLSHGGFVSTYKFALLRAITDLCVQRGSEIVDGELRIETWRIAERFVEQYWRHGDPFPGASLIQPLQQNSDRQIALLRHIEEYRRAGGALRPGSTDPAWLALRREVEKVVRVMPLRRLQTVGRQELRFLYEVSSQGDYIDLLPGVAETLRRFHGLVHGLVQEAWVRLVRRLPANRTLLGQHTDLSEFLFGSERSDLGTYRPLLMAIQRARCFYCEGTLGGGGEVDHFIPWSRYPRDLGHNFVLACPACNSAKSDLLAAPRHLERWLLRNVDHGPTLEEGFRLRLLPHDMPTSREVARWAYDLEEAAGGTLWVRGKRLLPIDGSWRALLAA